MSINDIKSILSVDMPVELADGLLESYTKGLAEYRKGNWKYFTTEIGQFNEMGYRIIENKLTSNYTPIKSKLPIFNEKVLTTWEMVNGKTETERIILPRVLYSMYCIRNKRGMIHKNDVDPNKMDATNLLSNAKWILAELVRTASGVKWDDATIIIDSILSKNVDVVWDTGNCLRILEPSMSFKNQILLLLYVNGTMDEKQLLRATEYSNPNVFKNLLSKMHKERILEYDGTNCTISPKGIDIAEEIILREEKKSPN